MPTSEEKQIREIHAMIGASKAHRESSLGGTVPDNSEELKKEAIRMELEQMFLKKVFETITRIELEEKYKDVMPIDSLMFLKCKFNANGSFNKWKARLAARGDQQDGKFPSETSSPTANMASINLILNYGVEHGLKIATSDVPGAYLHAELNELVVMKLPRSCTTIWLELIDEPGGFDAKDTSM